MEALNGSVFLPLLAVLALLGLKISLFPIHVGETDVATNVGIPQLPLDLVWEEEASSDTAHLKNGKKICVEIPSVVSVAEIPLVM